MWAIISKYIVYIGLQGQVYAYLSNMTLYINDTSSVKVSLETKMNCPNA